VQAGVHGDEQGLRSARSSGPQPPLSGDMEAEETFVGGKPRHQVKKPRSATSTMTRTVKIQRAQKTWREKRALRR
jgi:hypothetical protein